MTRLAVPLAIVCCALTLGACGRDRHPAGQARAAPPAPSMTVEVARAGLTVDLPRNAALTRPATGTTVLSAQLAGPAVTVFAYRRTEQLPRNARELADARRRLAAAVQRRDAGYRLIDSRATQVDGNRAVELDGEQTFSRTPTRIRSLHVFKGAAEYVVEMAAPTRDFARFDRTVGQTVERSLRVTGRVRGA